MATNYKVLGQVAPVVTTATTLYTAPTDTQAVVSSIVVTNRGSASGRFRISIRPAGAAQSDEHYIVFDSSVAGLSLVTLTVGITLAATDVITVYASSGDFSFNAYGTEITL